MVFGKLLITLRQNGAALAKTYISFRQLQTTPYFFAGHSKWANIKHIKALKDGQKAALFTKISRQIRIAIQEGGSTDPVLNSQLKMVVDDALKKNMPMSTIQNNIKKCQQSKTILKKCRLDIRYKKNIYMICTIYTDNFPGLKMDMTAMVKKSGGIFMDVGFMFDNFGLVEARNYASGGDIEERATEDAIECGAEEVEIVDAKTGTVNFICNPEHLSSLSKALEEKSYCIENAEHVYVPKNVVQLSADEQSAYDTFLRKMRDIPGLEDIYDNVDIDGR